MAVAVKSEPLIGSQVTSRVVVGLYDGVNKVNQGGTVVLSEPVNGEKSRYAPIFYMYKLQNKCIYKHLLLHCIVLEAFTCVFNVIVLLIDYLII